MKINILTMYKVIEADHVIAIMAHNDQLKALVHVELMAGPLGAVAEYLTRYMAARATGLTIDQAHKEALHGAIIVDDGERGQTDKILQ